jgi:hypothetical protein
MRMLTALHITIESAPGTYISNPNAESLTHPSQVGGMKFINRPTLKVMANVVPYMRANGGKFPQFPDASKNQVSVANFTHGMSVWELFRSDPEVLADFSAYLSGRREDMVGYWFDIWPAKEKIVSMLADPSDDSAEDRALVVDVGGNVGYDLQAFQGRFPDLKGKGRLVLQDLPENIKNAKILLDGTGIEAMEYDFFTPQPVKGSQIPPFLLSVLNIHTSLQEPEFITSEASIMIGRTQTPCASSRMSQQQWLLTAGLLSMRCPFLRRKRRSTWSRTMC